jgi:putative ABC transport system permease protein
MNLRESALMAFIAIRTHKLRSVLTSLGIVIGLMTIVGMVSIIQGFNTTVATFFQSLGTNTFLVTKYPQRHMSTEEYFRYRRRKDLTVEECEAIIRLCPAVAAAAPTYGRTRLVKRGDKTMGGCEVIATTPDYPEVIGVEMEEGRFFSHIESQHRRHVCIIGYDVVDELFDQEDPLGQHITVGGSRFRVIGVMERRGRMFGQSLDNFSIVPTGTFNLSSGRRRSAVFLIKAKSKDLLETAQDQVEQVLRRVRRVPREEENDFEITSQEAFMEMWRNLTGAIFVAMVGISSIALVVGGIGIMNIMLVSVAERTREIGIRKAVGARRRHILWQFLIESVFLCAVGGMVGIGAGIAIAFLISSFTPLPASISVWSMVVGLVIIGSTGIFFGIYPASKAARMDPVEALRHE